MIVTRASGSVEVDFTNQVWFLS